MPLACQGVDLYKESRNPRQALLGEELLDLLHPRLGARAMAVAVQLRDPVEFAQQLALTLGQVHAGLAHDVAQQVPVLAAAHPADALAAQPEDLARLRFLGNLDLRRAVERGNLDLPSE